MIPEKVRAAVLEVGLRSRDLVWFRYADDDDEGTLNGLCFVVCRAVHELCPDMGFRLARFRTGPRHFFLVSRNHRILDLTSRAYLPAKYRLRVMVPWEPITRKAKTFLNRVRARLAEDEET